MSDKRNLKDKKDQDRSTSKRGTSHNGIDQPPLANQGRLSVRNIGPPSIDPDRADINRAFFGSNKKNPQSSFDSVQWFKVLVELQRPVTRARARQIRRQYHLNPILIKDPIIGKQGLELLLFLGSVAPHPVIRGIAMVLIFSMAISKGDYAGAAISVIPIPNLSKALKIARQASRPVAKQAIRLMPVASAASESLKYYKGIARIILNKRSGTVLKKVLKDIKPLRNAYETKAAKAAAKEYQKVLKKTGNPRVAAQKAGSKYHEIIGAAGPGKGVDFTWKKGGKHYMGDVKTHWFNGVHDDMLNWSNETMLAYILKSGVERKLISNTLVQHVFIDVKTGKAMELIIRPFSPKEIAAINEFVLKNMR